MNLDELEQFTINVAREAGRLLMRYRRRADFCSKADGSVQTPADVAAEALVRRRTSAAYPEAGFLGEESYASVQTRGLLWICDPLDGTTNFLRGHPIWGVSLAAFQDGEPLVGVVHFPLLRETFSAIQGRGTRRNGAAVQVADTDGAQFSDVYTLSSRHWNDYAVNGMTSSLRCFGSCAYHLAQLSCGGIVGCWEYNPKIWDLAAGLLLVREAGGIIRMMDGSDPIQKFVNSSADPGQALPILGACNDLVLERMLKGHKECDSGASHIQPVKQE